ncbi:MAG: DUF86 domain-containing protein [Candidatus Kuenenbacteria bacterium]
MPKRNIKLYLEDIRVAIRKIEKYTEEVSLKLFESDEKTIDAVIRNLEVIGEAVNNIPKQTRDKYPNVPWRKIISMRNKVLHEYFGIDWDILWQTIKEDIPELKKQINKIRKNVVKR